MKRHLALVLSGAILLVSAGCAWVPQTVTLTLNPTIAPVDIGRGLALSIRVMDQRPEKILGYRGLDSKNAAITTKQDVAATVQQSILEGLACKGFAAQPYAQQAGRLLTIEVRQIEYSTEMEFWKGIIRTKVTLRARTNRDGAPFDQTYVAERKDSAVEAPAAKTNEALINGAISDAVQKLVEDERLLFFLVE